MNDTKLLSLFPIPLYSSTLEVTDELKQKVQQVEFERHDCGSADISKNKYILNQPQFAELREVIDRHVQDYGHRIFSPDDGVEFVLKNSWVMRHPPGGHNYAHIHMNSLISGVVYINVTPESGDIVFHNTHNNLQLGMIDIGTKNRNVFNSKSFNVTPKEGEMFIFPSSLVHRAEVNQSNIIRYCVPFNYFVKGTLCKDGPEELVLL